VNGALAKARIAKPKPEREAAALLIVFARASAIRLRDSEDHGPSAGRGYRRGGGGAAGAAHTDGGFGFGSHDSRKQKRGRPTVSHRIERRGHGSRSTRHRADRLVVSDLLFLRVRADARIAAAVPASTHWRCFSAALATSARRRPTYGQCAAPALFVGSIRPDAIQRPYFAGVHGFNLSRIRQGTPAAPRLHSTAIWQDKNRNVRRGRAAEKRRHHSIVAQCALLPCNVDFEQTPAKSRLAAHCPEYRLRHRKPARDRVHLGHSAVRGAGR
jgi:hypothetical protein